LFPIGRSAQPAFGLPPHLRISPHSRALRIERHASSMFSCVEAAYCGGMQNRDGFRIGRTPPSLADARYLPAAHAKQREQERLRARSELDRAASNPA